MSRAASETCPLSGARRWTRYGRPVHHPVQARVGRVDARTATTGVQMIPCVRAIQASTGLVQPSLNSRRRGVLRPHNHNVATVPPGG